MAILPNASNRMQDALFSAMFKATAIEGRRILVLN